MQAEQVVRALLLADVGLSGLVGDRIWPLTVPPGALVSDDSYITTQVISNVPRPVIDAWDSSPHFQARVQVDCVASSYAALCTLVAQVRAALHLKRGIIAGTRVTSVTLSVEGPQDFDEEQRLFVQPVDFILTYQQGA